MYIDTCLIQLTNMVVAPYSKTAFVKMIQPLDIIICILHRSVSLSGQYHGLVDFQFYVEPDSITLQEICTHPPKQ